MLSRKNSFSRGFFSSLMIYSGIYMAVQDYMGLEGWIEWLRDHWVDLPWGVGAIGASIGVLGAISTIVRNSCE